MTAAEPDVRARRAALGVAIAAVAAALLVWGVWTLQAPPSGVAPVAWDRVRCARCGMLVSEPDFAAQVQLRDGTVLDFDDPGCMLLHRAEHPEQPVRAVWLHVYGEDAWIPEGEARFDPVAGSPMGYGLATRRSGSLSVEAALERAKTRDAERRRRDDARAP